MNLRFASVEKRQSSRCYTARTCLRVSRESRASQLVCPRLAWKRLLLRPVPGAGSPSQASTSRHLPQGDGRGVQKSLSLRQ